LEVKRALTVVREFVAAINEHDLDRLLGLMTEDHVFIDSGGATVHGRESMGRAWQGYFGMVPDYRIRVEEAIESGDLVVLLGTAGGTYSVAGKLEAENRWETPAAWRALVRDDRVAGWRVYADNEPIRLVMGRVSDSG